MAQVLVPVTAPVDRHGVQDDHPVEPLSTQLIVIAFWLIQGIESPKDISRIYSYCCCINRRCHGRLSSPPRSIHHSR